jgi:hypothetical protein
VDLVPCHGGTTAPRSASLLTSATVHAAPRKGLVCVALSYGGRLDGPFWRSETIALLRRGRRHGRAAERENDWAIRSTTEPMRVVTFYVSDPDTPFLDPIFMSASVISAVLTARRSISVSPGKRRATPSRAPRHRHGLSAEPRAKIVRPEDENQESNPAPRVPFRS